MADTSAATPSKRTRASASEVSGDVVSESTPKTGDKRKRGRPRKFPEGTFPKPNPDGPKRGRGRPRKILTAAETAAAAKKAEAAKNTPSKGRGRPRKEPGTSTPKPKPTPKDGKKDGRGRPRKSLPANGDEAASEPAFVAPKDTSGRSYWLMKAEPESRMEKGADVKFSIDDLAAAKVPEPWDGVRNPVARNLMRNMKKGDQAFFYHSNCKTPGVVGIMEIVQEHSTDESAFDPKHPYHDPKATRENPKWVVVHVEFRRKLKTQVTLDDLKSHADAGKPLENLQTLKQSRLSVSSVTPAQWAFILQLAGEEPVESKEESKEESNKSSSEEEASEE